MNGFAIFNFAKGYTAEGEFLFESNPGATAADPAALVGDQDPFAGLADAPPPISGYRPADIAGMACWNCAHFTAVGDSDNDGDIDGICNLFEAKAEGEFTCDRFTAHSDMFRQGPHTSWQEDLQRMQSDSMGPSVMESEYSDSSLITSLNFSGPAVEEDGLVWKDILRTGEWSHTPTGQGVVRKRLQIIRDGESDPANGIISLSEVASNFDEGAIPYVTVPLSDDEKDHKNIARLNTGFVRRVKIEDRDDISVLRAGIDFTEPDVKGKVLRGTIPDVSAGVPFNVVRRSDNRLFRTVLDHVCLTRKPFVDRLQPFGIAAADGDELPVEAYEQGAGDPSPSPVAEDPPPPTSENGGLTFRQLQSAIQSALADQLRLSPEYRVEDVGSNIAIVEHSTSRVRWEVPFEIADGSLFLGDVNNWKPIEEATPPPAPEPAGLTASDDLQHARTLRELRLGQPTSQPGGIEMSTLSLDGVELSELPEGARSRIQSILDENATLKRDNASSRVDQRIEELKTIPGLNFSDRPGALKFYRQVMLDDDGGAAVVLFSDEQDESKKERLTALQILDRFIDGLKADGGVQLSDQHLASGNDNPPPLDASRERTPVKDRVKEANKALYGNEEGQARRRRPVKN